MEKKDIALTEVAQRNLQMINNFILYLTHRSPEDHNYKERFMITAETMYDEALNYISEDHVDGKDRQKPEPADSYKIVTASTADQLQQKVLTLTQEGWKPQGAHQVVCLESYDQYSGTQHRAVQYKYQFSQTLTR